MMKHVVSKREAKGRLFVHDVALQRETLTVELSHKELW